MKRLLLLLFVALLPWVAEADRKGGDVPSGKALLRLEEHVHNFGDVPHRGGELVYEFRFTNSGTAPLSYNWKFTVPAAASATLYMPFAEPKAVTQSDVLTIAGTGLHILVAECDV